MSPALKLERVKSFKDTHNLIIGFQEIKDLKFLKLKKDEMDYLQELFARDEKIAEINQFYRFLYFVKLEKNRKDLAQVEEVRRHGATIQAHAAKHKLTNLAVSITDPALAYAMAEGVMLANYQFLKYRSDRSKVQNSLTNLALSQEVFSKDKARELEVIVQATLTARELVNEPNSYLTATVFARHIRELCEEAGCRVEVMDKGKIEKLQMGGLLAVNKGSLEPPTFTVIEWKPKKARNLKPLVLVGKGVVYDTGGLSLKPTPNSMDTMKCDMAGGAAVAATLYAIASLKSDVHVIGLVPATDNRPGGSAYAPGDVVKMMNGKTVEVLNTDAEGRMILADALTYADRFEPELVLNTATLTGAAMRAIGTYGIVGMGTAAGETMKKVQLAGERVYERVVEFPFWKEYDEEIKSEIADLKNLGSDLGGAITAGKFLAHFTNAPLIHLDIAGPAFLSKPSAYRKSGGTGVGVRLFTDFILNY
jgi:leucyl aminopeptidase